jgi:hypothetical protein
MEKEQLQDFLVAEVLAPTIAASVISCNYNCLDICGAQCHVESIAHCFSAHSNRVASQPAYLASLCKCTTLT